MQDFLREFWAVTISCSVYRVRVEGASAVARKIASFGSTSRRSVNWEIPGGSMVAIAQQLHAYFPTPKEHRFDFVSTVHHGGCSSEIVALFLDEDSALGCMIAEGLRGCDRRWHDRTQNVLALIGDDHPFLYISRNPVFGFPLAKAAIETTGRSD